MTVPAPGSLRNVSEHPFSLSARVDVPLPSRGVGMYPRWSGSRCLRGVASTLQHTLPVSMMQQEFKYAVKLALFTSCPPPDSAPVKVTLFRYVHQDPDHKNNWRPPAEIDPRRANMQCCAGYALSFLTSKEAARRRYSRLAIKYPKISTALGEYLATVDVQPEHGFLSPRGEHRDLHEYFNASFFPTEVEPI